MSLGLSEYITEKITGDESVTQVVVILFIVICFSVAVVIFSNNQKPTQAGIYIGTPEQQLKPHQI
mgnify:CR=1 FL=1